MKLTVDKSGTRLAVWAGAIALVAGCFTAYIPAMQAGFIWDDDLYVTDNPLLTAPDGLYRIWFSTDAPSQYFPLTYTSFWVEKRLWDLNPAGYHFVNVVIHCLNALLLWLILKKLSIPWPWLASAIFALHPVQVESVAWITERKNILMLFFSLLSVLCWVKFVFDNQNTRRTILLYAGSLLFCALALFSKATACVLPAALLLILWFKHSPITAKRWLQVAPFIAMGIGIGLLVMWWERHNQGTGFVNFGLSPVQKSLIAGKGLWFYLGKLIWPANLMFSYPRWHIDATDIWQYIWPASFILMASAAWLLKKRTGRGIFAALLFFSACLFPTLGFFPLYTFVYTFVADHYQYAACIGPIAVLAAGSGYLFCRLDFNGKVILLSAAGALLVTLGILTWRQCRIYTSPDTLWADTLNKNPDSWLAHGQIGESLFKQGKLDEALIQLELASYLKKIHPMAYSDVYFQKALIFTAKGKLADAVKQYKLSLEVDEKSALVHYLFADVLVKQGKVEEAIVQYRRGLEIAKAKGANNLADEIQHRLEVIEKQSPQNKP
jgi:tetratricopeptide (TPR) repeat protein